MVTPASFKFINWITGTPVTIDEAMTSALTATISTDLQTALNTVIDTYIDANIQNFDAWAVQPLGVPIAVYSSLLANPLTTLPPTNQAYRYVLLTAGEADPGEYNAGIVDNEVVSGVAPLVLATFDINYPTSIFDNVTVRLLNTERRFLRAGSVGTAEFDALQNVVGTVLGSQESLTGTGAFTVGTAGTSLRPGNGVATVFRVNFSLALDTNARTDTETRTKNLGMNYVMRIK